MCDQSFRTCKHCGNLVGMIHASGVPMICCGEEMEEIKPNTVDASKEKHVPVVSIDQNQVSVAIGSEPHPMLEAHYIQWIYLKGSQGGQRRCLGAGDAAKVTFVMTDGDKPAAVYAYCNLHGLWMTEVEG